MQRSVSEYVRKGFNMLMDVVTLLFSTYIF
jgi:hypothetical protein